ncbi:hypothetical protein ABEF95_007158 [Exophiala dermatitidis]
MAATPIYRRYERRGGLSHQLLPRQQPSHEGPQGGGDNGGGIKGSAVAVAVIAVLVVLIAGSVLVYSLLRRLKLKGKSARYIPTEFLKRKWRTWTPGGKYAAVRNNELLSTNTAYNGNDAGARQTGPGVDRNTSVRSVITLPAYSRTPKDTEQVLAREGEREGMDTVVEFPETQDEEESRREELMESLYQIRLARRREIAEREELRRERREARERGDTARLEELRRQSRQRANESVSSLNGGASLSAATLIAEHQSRGRERRVSTVAYGALGEVRHDGTRLRANSNDSERGGLLSGAAPMGEMGGRARQFSDAASTSTVSRAHTRDRSNSGLSASTMNSDMEAEATPGSIRAHSSHSDGPTSLATTSSPTANRFTPDESTGSDDIGESRIPQGDEDGVTRPPEYDEVHGWGEAPAYDVAVATQPSVTVASSTSARDVAPQLPQLSLPSISVSGATEPNTPATPHMETVAFPPDEHH